MGKIGLLMRNLGSLSKKLRRFPPVAEATFPHYDKSSNKSKIDSESHGDL